MDTWHHPRGLSEASSSRNLKKIHFRTSPSNFARWCKVEDPSALFSSSLSVLHDCAKISHGHAKLLFTFPLVCCNQNPFFSFRMTMWKFRTGMQNAPGMRNWCWCIFHFAQSCEIVGACAKLHFSRFLGEEVSEIPLGWCQVSTWTWPINRNLIYSFGGLLDIF